MTLNPQQERFAQEYAVDLNATRAAIRAGYSAATAYSQGPRLLNDVGVAKRIEELKEKITKRIDITAERIIREYEKIAFTNLEDVVDWISGDPMLRSAADIETPAHGAISEITRTESKLGDITIKVKLHDKRGALDSLARYKGLFNDRLELGGKVEGSFWIDFTKQDAKNNDTGEA